MRCSGGGGSKRRGDREVIRRVAVRSARVVDLCIDGLEMRAGENPVDVLSAGPAGEEMHRAFVARGDRMRGAKNVVQRRRRGSAAERAACGRAWNRDRC